MSTSTRGVSDAAPVFCMLDGRPLDSSYVRLLFHRLGMVEYSLALVLAWPTLIWQRNPTTLTANLSQVYTFSDPRTYAMSSY